MSGGRGEPSAPGADAASRIYRPPWRVDVVRRAGVRAPAWVSVVGAAVAAALEAADAPGPGSVTVVLTNDEELSDLNAEHMGQEGPTDVLSFPMLPPEAFRGRGGPGGYIRIAPPQDRPRRTERIHIGDIAISLERAIEQAEQGRGGQTGDIRWSAADELRLLVTHGTLHLCGWDHSDRAEESEMRALERRLLGR